MYKVINTHTDRVICEHFSEWDAINSKTKLESNDLKNDCYEPNQYKIIHEDHNSTKKIYRLMVKPTVFNRNAEPIIDLWNLTFNDAAEKFDQLMEDYNIPDKNVQSPSHDEHIGGGAGFPVIVYLLNMTYETNAE